MFATLAAETVAGLECLVVVSIDEDETLGAVPCGETVAAGDIYSGGGFLARAGVIAARTPKSAEVLLADARAAKTAVLEEFARELRASVAGTRDATKLAVYQTKYETACVALDGSQAAQVALLALTPEANARGQTPAELAALVKGLGDQWRAAGLAIDAAYQTHKAAIQAATTLEDVEDYDAGAGWPV